MCKCYLSANPPSQSAQRVVVQNLKVYSRRSTKHFVSGKKQYKERGVNLLASSHAIKLNNVVVPLSSLLRQQEILARMGAVHPPVKVTWPFRCKHFHFDIIWSIGWSTTEACSHGFNTHLAQGFFLIFCLYISDVCPKQVTQGGVPQTWVRIPPRHLANNKRNKVIENKAPYNLVRLGQI